MTEFLFIRHGETDWNREHRFQGQIDVPLNAMGREQAARLGERMRAERFDALVCSDLLRARETAMPVAQIHGQPPKAHSSLREQAFGVLEGMNMPTIRQQYPHLWTQWLRYEADHAMPGGGESVREFHARVMRAVAVLAETYPGQRVAVVTHGGVLDMLWRSARGAALDGPRECDIPNTGINHLGYAAGRLDIIRWADAEHLAGLPDQPSTRPAPAAATSLAA